MPICLQSRWFVSKGRTNIFEATVHLAMFEGTGRNGEMQVQANNDNRTYRALEGPDFVVCLHPPEV